MNNLTEESLKEEMYTLLEHKKAVNQQFDKLINYAKNAELREETRIISEQGAVYINTSKYGTPWIIFPSNTHAMVTTWESKPGRNNRNYYIYFLRNGYLVESQKAAKGWLTRNVKKFVEELNNRLKIQHAIDSDDVMRSIELTVGFQVFAVNVTPEFMTNNVMPLLRILIERYRLREGYYD